MNNLPPLQYADIVIEDFVCRQPGMESYVEEFDLDDDAERSLSQYRDGALAYIKTRFRKFTRQEALVDDETAKARALICLNCDYNAESKQAGVVKKVTDGWMQTLTKDKSTKYDGALQDCQKCGGCPLKAKIWISKEVIDSTTSDDVKAKLRTTMIGKNGSNFHCWAK